MTAVPGAGVVAAAAGSTCAEVLAAWAREAAVGAHPHVVLVLEPVVVDDLDALVLALTAPLEDPWVAAVEPVMLVEGTSPARPRRPAGRVLAVRREEAAEALARALASGPADGVDPAVALCGALLAVSPQREVRCVAVAVGTPAGEWVQSTGLEVRSPSRWALRTAVPFDAGRESWGDLHFARALREALGDQHRRAQVEYRTYRFRAAAPFDGVVLVLRGTTRLDPAPGPVRLMWVISHPDEVSAGELAAYDHIFSAGAQWAREAAARTEVPVTTLLQATAVTGAVSPSGIPAPVLFVANARDVRRPVLTDAIAAGAEVTVHGQGWDTVMPELTVAGTYLPNDEVPGAYAAAGVVLNDHWDDMRAGGFVSNRLFDAVASGARVLSDAPADVDLGTLFDGSVRSYEPGDVAGVRALLADPAAAWPDADTRAATAARVRREHGFAARAATLVATADSLTG